MFGAQTLWTKIAAALFLLLNWLGNQHTSAASIPPSTPSGTSNTPVIETHTASSSPATAAKRVGTSTVSTSSTTTSSVPNLYWWFPPSMQPGAANTFTLYLSGGGGSGSVSQNNSGGGGGGGGDAGPRAPTITFPDISKIFGDLDFALAATSNSAGTFSYSVSDPTVATVTGDTVTIIGIGTATLTAVQAADGDYTAATTTAVLTVHATPPTFSGFNDLTKTFGGSTFDISPPHSNSSGGFSYTSSNPAVATISGIIVTMVGAGTTTITATQAANGNYTSASTTATLTVNPKAPTLTFNAISKNFGDPNFTLFPSSNSAGTFSFLSSDPTVATVSGSTLHIVGVGTSLITALQAASGNYTSSSTITTLTVNAIAPTISFTPVTKNFGDANFDLSATSNSVGLITYTSSNTSVATVSLGNVTIVGAGTTTLTASQAADGNYSSGSATTTLTVNRIAPTLGALSDSTAHLGDTPITITDPTSNSAGTFSYTTDNPIVATVSDNSVTINSIGSATITATQAASGNYTSASTTATVTVLNGFCEDNPGWCNAGICSDQPGYAAQCTCPDPWYGGDRCDSCNPAYDSCKNGAQCIPDIGGVFCLCTADFCGLNCAQLADPVMCPGGQLQAGDMSLSQAMSHTTRSFVLRSSMGVTLLALEKPAGNQCVAVAHQSPFTLSDWRAWHRE